MTHVNGDNGRQLVVGDSDSSWSSPSRITRLCYDGANWLPDPVHLPTAVSPQSSIHYHQPKT